MPTKPIVRVAELAKSAGVLRPRDLEAHGIARQYLRRAVENGLIVRSGRELCVAVDGTITEFHTLAEAAKRTPRSTICLLSALRFHDIGTQSPFRSGSRSARKTADRATITSGCMSCASQNKHLNTARKLMRSRVCRFASLPVAKTVADCFKYRNKIGLDVGLEALRECLRTRKATTADLWEAAKICRVANVMRPYIEALT